MEKLDGKSPFPDGYKIGFEEATNFIYSMPDVSDPLVKRLCADHIAQWRREAGEDFNGSMKVRETSDFSGSGEQCSDVQQLNCIETRMTERVRPMDRETFEATFMSLISEERRKGQISTR